MPKKNLNLTSDMYLKLLSYWLKTAIVKIPERWGKDTICFRFGIQMGTICIHLSIIKLQPRILESFLLWVAGFIARHEEARIIEPVLNMRFDHLIDIAANTADELDVWVRKNRVKDIADAAANNDADSVFFKNLQPLVKGEMIKIEFFARKLQVIVKINQQQPGADIKNRWNPRFKGWV